MALAQRAVTQRPPASCCSWANNAIVVATTRLVGMLTRARSFFSRHPSALVVDSIDPSPAQLGSDAYSLEAGTGFTSFRHEPINTQARSPILYIGSTILTTPSPHHEGAWQPPEANNTDDVHFRSTGMSGVRAVREKHCAADSLLQNHSSRNIPPASLQFLQRWHGKVCKPKLQFCPCKPACRCRKRAWDKAGTLLGGRVCWLWGRHAVPLAMTAG
jgi:hypothetical protein